MTATVAQAWDALDAALAMDGVQVINQPTGNINPPALVTTPGEGEFFSFKTAFDGAAVLPMLIIALTNRRQDRASRITLCEFMELSGARSVYAAIESDPTLGGVVSSAAVLSASNFGSITFGGPEYLTCSFNVEIYL